MSAFDEEKEKEGRGLGGVISFFSFSIFITKHILNNGLWMSHSANPEGGRQNFVNCKLKILLVVGATHV